MCLSTIYVDSNGQSREVMHDVVGIEAENDGYTLIDLFGKQKFVRGTIKSVDFINEHKVVLEQGD
jgi:predicted RNA-binding protein